MMSVVIYNECGRIKGTIDNVVSSNYSRSSNVFFVIAADPYDSNNRTDYTILFEPGYRLEFVED